MTKTPYEVACEAIKWDKNGNPDHLPVPLASDMTKGRYRREGKVPGRHCAIGIALEISDSAVSVTYLRGFVPDFCQAYEIANHCVDTTSHNDEILRTNTARASAVQAAFAEMGYSA